MNTSGAALGAEIERVCLDNEWVIATWSPIHLHTKLNELYWKADKPSVKAFDFWQDTRRYLYLPRLKDRGVLAQDIVKGAGTTDFFGTAYGEHDGKFEGFKFGDANVQLHDTLQLIEPSAAAAYVAANKSAPPESTTFDPPVIPDSQGPPRVSESDDLGKGPGSTTPVTPSPGPPAKAKSFVGSAAVSPAAAKMRLVQIAEEIIAVLAADPNANVKVRVEIQAEFANGAQDQTKRTVSENAKTLNFATAEWE